MLYSESDILDRMAAMGISFYWNDPQAGICDLSPGKIKKALASSSKYPLETCVLGITDEEYEKWMEWSEGGFQCLANTKKGKRCAGVADRNKVPIKDFEKLGFCRTHDRL